MSISGAASLVDESRLGRARDELHRYWLLHDPTAGILDNGRASENSVRRIALVEDALDVPTYWRISSVAR